MNWLDILLAIILLACVFEGVSKGLAKTAVGFVAMILGFFLGLWFYGVAGGWLTEYLKSPQLANLIGFFIIFIGVTVLGGVVGWGLDRLLKLAKLSWLNRILGGAFGLVRGVLTAAIVVLVALAFSTKPDRPSSVANSRLAPYVIETARIITAAAPREVKNAFYNSYERVKQIWADTLKNGIRKNPEREIQ